MQEKFLTRIDVTFNTEKGLIYNEKKKYNVIKENDEALVIDNANFTTIYKERGDRVYSDVLNDPRDTNIGIYGVENAVRMYGYFDDEQKGVEIIKKKIHTFLVEKEEYYRGLIQKLKTFI